jgi:hypothetical protein
MTLPAAGIPAGTGSRYLIRLALVPQPGPTLAGSLLPYPRPLPSRSHVARTCQVPAPIDGQAGLGSLPSPSEHGRLTHGGLVVGQLEKVLHRLTPAALASAGIAHNSRACQPSLHAVRLVAGCRCPQRPRLCVGLPRSLARARDAGRQSPFAGYAPCRCACCQRCAGSGLAAARTGADGRRTAGRLPEPAQIPGLRAGRTVRTPLFFSIEKVAGKAGRRWPGLAQNGQ